MKTLFLLVALSIFIPSVNFCQSNIANLTAHQIWRRVIQYYDPDGRWDTFRGEMHLYTIHPGGGSSEEDLILDNAAFFYQSTLFYKDHIIIKRLDKDIPFFSLNGRTELTEEEKMEFQLHLEGLRQIYQHHQVHFGLPMHFEAIGLPIDPKVNKEIFNKINCWVLTVQGKKGEVYGHYYDYPIRLYVNPEDYRLVGIKYDNQGGELPASYVIFSDEIEIGGILIPKIKTYYLVENDTYWFTDVFYPFTRVNYGGEEAEKEAILQLLEEETRYFYVRDYENWAKCWSHQEDVFFSYCSKTFYIINKGWRELGSYMQNYMRENPDPHLPPIKRSDYVFHLQGNLAWVYFNNQEGDASGQHQRVLRKENGIWKMINMTGIDEASYKD